MFLSLINGYNLLWAATEMLAYLLLFVSVVSLIVLVLRKPMRQYKPLDMLVFNKLQGLHTAYNNNLMLTFTYLGKHDFLIPANLVLIVAFLIFGRNWYAFRMLAMSLSSLSLMFLLKHLFRRKRPLAPLLQAVRGKSFPSGHAIMAVNFYGLLLYMLLQSGIDPLLKIAAVILIIPVIAAIGFSRIYLKVHYASDVLAGFIIGISWFYTSLLILTRLEFIIFPGLKN